jgi:hypothetical protein
METKILEISFSANWNKKLDCDFFTTIRLHNPQKYRKGYIYKIVYGEIEFMAECLNVKTFSRTIINPKPDETALDEIPDYILSVDTGFLASEARVFIKNLYKNYHLDWNKQEIDLILLRKVKHSEESKKSFMDDLEQAKQLSLFPG